MPRCLNSMDVVMIGTNVLRIAFESVPIPDINEIDLVPGEEPDVSEPRFVSVEKRSS